MRRSTVSRSSPVKKRLFLEQNECSWALLLREQCGRSDVLLRVDVTNGLEERSEIFCCKLRNDP